MSELKGFQKKYLRGLAHSMNPVVLIGQKGVNESVIKSVDEALGTHELIKVKFNEFKEKEQKKELISVIEKKSRCEQVGLIGHIAIFYKKNKDPKKQKISVPVK